MSKLDNKNIEILSPPEEVDMADDWYQFASLDHFWIKSRFRAIKSRLAKEKIGHNLFEVGCGHGVVIKQFEEAFDVSVDGCDLNMLALSKIDKIKGRILCLDIFKKPPELLNKYDGVVLMDVIEHIDNDAEFLKTSLTYTKNEGLVLINVPALNFLFSKYDVEAGHKRRYDKRMMRKLFSTCGIEEVSIFYWGFSLFPIAIIRKFVLMFVSKDKIISTGFKTPNSLINRTLNRLLKTENKLFTSPFIGTSLIGIGRVKNVQK